MWLFLGLASGFFYAVEHTFSKRALKNNINYYLVAFAPPFFSLPFLSIALLKLDLVTTNFTFWWATIASAIFYVSGLVILMKALSIGELSQTIPFLALTPVFLLLTSWVLLGEFPSALGLLGIFFIVAGVYFLEQRGKGALLTPFKTLMKDKAALLALSAAFIYAIGASMNKVAIREANPITFLIWWQSISVLMLVPLIYLKSEQKFAEIKNKWKYLLPIGLFAAVTLLAQITAFTLNIVPYIISLKRTSAFFSVILGVIAFKERNIKPKLLGAALMVAGVFLIALS